MSSMDSLDFAQKVIRYVWAKFIDHFDAAANVDRLYSGELLDGTMMEVVLSATSRKDATRAFLTHLMSNATIESLEKLCKLLRDTAQDHPRHDRLAKLLEAKLKQWKVPLSSHVVAQRGAKGVISRPSLQSVITLTEELLPFLDHFLPHLLLLGVVLGIDNLVAILNGRGSAKEKCLNILEMWLRRTANPTRELFCSLLQRHATFNHVRSLIMEARAHGMSHATREMNVKTVIQSLRSYLTETLPIDTDLLTALHGNKLIAAGNIKPWKSLLFHGKENEVRCELVDYIEGFYTPEYLAMFTDLLLKQSKKSKPILKDIAEKLRVEMGKGNIELLRSDELWEQLIITYEQNGNTCKEHEFPTGFVKKRIESSKSTKVSSSYFFKQSAESDPVEVEFGPPVTIPWGKDLPEKVLGKEKLDLARMRPAWSGALKELPQAARKLASDQEQKPAEEA